MERITPESREETEKACPFRNEKQSCIIKKDYASTNIYGHSILCYSSNPPMCPVFLDEAKRQYLREFETFNPIED